MKPTPTRKLTLDERAKRRLKRLEKKRAQTIPLFVATGIADQIQPLPSLEETKAFIAHCQQDVCRRVLTIQYRALGQAAHYQALVATLVSPAQLRQFYAERKIYPRDPTYAADFWRSTHERMKALP